MKSGFVYFLFIVLTLAGCSSTIGTNVAHPPKPYNEVYYRFEKGLFLPNRYYLTVVNHSDKTVSFFTDRDSNFLTLESGKNVVIIHTSGSWDFMDKGMVWINPGESLSISFDIDRNEFRNAKMITFKGQTSIAMKRGEGWMVTPDRQLIVTYDVRTTEFSVKEGPLLVNNNVQKLLGGKQVDPLAPVNKDQFKLKADSDNKFFMGQKI